MSTKKIWFIVLAIFLLCLVYMTTKDSASENMSTEDLIIETIDSSGGTISSADYIEELKFVEQVDSGYVCVAVTYGKQIIIAYLEPDPFSKGELWISAYEIATLNVLIRPTKSDFEKLYAGNMNSKRFYFSFTNHDGEETAMFNGTEVPVNKLDLFNKEIDFWFYLEN